MRGETRPMIYMMGSDAAGLVDHGTRQPDLRIGHHLKYLFEHMVRDHQIDPLTLQSVKLEKEESTFRIVVQLDRYILDDQFTLLAEPTRKGAFARAACNAMPSSALDRSGESPVAMVHSEAQCEIIPSVWA
jgi:hypothetical protein